MKTKHQPSGVLDDLEEKMRYLEAIVALDPGLEWAQTAVEDIRYQQVRMN